MDDMLSWLRATIMADLEAAKAADEVAPGPWVNTGQRGCGDAWQIHGAPTGETTFEYDRDTEKEREVPELRRVATLNYEDGGGVWEREAADHIVLQQPRDVIARCTAELEILDQVLPEVRRVAVRLAEEFGGIWPDGKLTSSERMLLKTLASGYRHRPGFKAEWVSD